MLTAGRPINWGADRVPDATSPEQAVAAGIDAITHGATWIPGLLRPGWQEFYLMRRREVGAIRARIDRLAWVERDGPEIQGSIQAVARARTLLDPTLIAYATKFLGRHPRYRNSPYLRVAPQKFSAPGKALSAPGPTGTSSGVLPCGRVCSSW